MNAAQHSIDAKSLPARTGSARGWLMRAVSQVRQNVASVLAGPVAAMDQKKQPKPDAPTAEESLRDTLIDIPAMDEDPVKTGETVLQHMVRVRDAEGHESIHFTLRGELPANERFATLFIGFCPPFEELPQVDAEVMEGPSASCKVTQVLHHGAQIDIELDEAQSEPAAVMIEAVAYQHQNLA